MKSGKIMLKEVKNRLYTDITHLNNLALAFCSPSSRLEYAKSFFIVKLCKTDIKKRLRFLHVQICDEISLKNVIRNWISDCHLSGSTLPSTRADDEGQRGYLQSRVERQFNRRRDIW
jgi:hypothetical protein